MKKSLFRPSIMAVAIILSAWGYSGLIAGAPLAVTRNDTNAIVSWPYPSTGFGLEFSTNLSVRGWQLAAGTSASNNGRWEVTAPIDQPGGFFRLKNHLQHFGFWAGSLAPQGSIVEQNGSVNFTYLQGGGVGSPADQAVAAGMKLLLASPDFNDANAI